MRPSLLSQCNTEITPARTVALGGCVCSLRIVLPRSDRVARFRIPLTFTCASETPCGVDTARGPCGAGRVAVARAARGRRGAARVRPPGQKLVAIRVLETSGKKPRQFVIWIFSQTTNCMLSAALPTSKCGMKMAPQSNTVSAVPSGFRYAALSCVSTLSFALCPAAGRW